MILGSTLVLKIMVAGDGGVGKTTLIRKFVSGSFNGATAMTNMWWAEKRFASRSGM